MPVDEEAVPFKRHPDGRETFIMSDGTVAKGNRNSWEENDSRGYMSHFATCPNADDFRKRGKKVRKVEAMP